MKKTLLLFLLVLLACSDPLAVTPDIRGDVVTATNWTDQRIFYFIVERELAARINWAACTDPEACMNSSIGARNSAKIPVDRIAGWDDTSKEAIFHWWHLTPTAGGAFEHDSIRSVVIRR